MEREYDRDRRDRDEPDDRDRDREPPRGSSNRSVWLILGAVGCGLFLVCSGLVVAAIMWGARSFTTDMPAAQAVGDQFLDHLRENKLDAAYALTSTRFRADHSREEFAEYIKKFETFSRHTSRTRNGFRLHHDTSGKRVYLQFTLNAPNNAMTCTLVLIEEADGWKVEKITVP